MTEEKALAIVAQGKSVDSLLVTELDALLVWHQVEKIKGGKKAEQLEQQKKILSDGQQLPEYEWWTEEDNERRIDMKDTQYGGVLALKEKDLEAAADKMNREKRDSLQQKFVEMDAIEVLIALASVNREEPVQVTASADGESGGV